MNSLFFLIKLIPIIFFTAWLQAETYVIKIATFAPEKSPWMTTMKKMATELEQESNGQLLLKFYPGGIAGSDKEVLEKMKAGKLHGAGLTSMGLGEILPEIRVMESPFAFSSYSEFDFVLDKLSENFKSKLLLQGYVLLGWTDQGFVYLMSKQKIDSTLAMSQTRSWVWKGDLVALSIAKSFGSSPVPLEPEEVLDAFQKSLVDTVYMTPLATLFFQWYFHVKYFVEMPVANAVGAVVISKEQWEKLPEKWQTLLREKAVRYTNQMVRSVRDLNEKTILVFKKKDIQFIALQPKVKEEFKLKGMEASESLVGTLYSKELLQKMQDLILLYYKK